MPRRSALLTGVTLATMSLSALPAQAATRYVDNDRAQCPAARYSSIQAAVSDAKPTDTIRVCAGTYREQVIVPFEQRGLTLLSHPRYAAILTAPDAFPSDGARPHALMILLAQRVRILGFEILGPLPPMPSGLCDSHTHPSGIAMPQGSATIQRNRFADLRLPGCSGQSQPVHAVHLGDVGGEFGGLGTRPTLVDRNVIDGSGVAVEGAFARITRNTIRGEGLSGVVFGDNAGGEMRGNDVSGQRIGVSGAGPDVGFFRVRGNRLHRNTYGVRLDVQSGSRPVIEHNFVEHNDYGLYVGFVPPGEVILRNNLARFNTVFDCFDELGVDGGSPGGDWVGNRGAASNPPGLCRP